MMGLRGYAGILGRAVVALLLGTGAAAAAESGAIQLRGSDSLAPIAQRVAEAFMAERPDVSVSIVANTTGRGVKAVLDGTADGALASSKISGEAKQRAKAQGVELVRHVVAHDAILVVVNADNPIAALSVEQLRAIYTGAVTDWSRVGGPAGRIRAYAVEPSSGTAGSWRHLVIGPRAIQSPVVSIVETAEMATRIARDPHAIGYIAGQRPGRGAKALAVGGVAATPDTLRDGRYPLARALSIVTKDPPSPLLKDFIDWFRAPDKGQKLVDAAGAAPLESVARK